MSEMVERVAKAIHEKHTNPDDNQHWFHEDASKCKLSRQLARAAIEAMREPTRGMVNAAWCDYELSQNGVLVHEPSTYHAEIDENLNGDTAWEVWTAMIDAALHDPRP